MQDSMFKSSMVLFVWVAAFPSFISVITSLVAIFYFASMLKVNVVNPNYSGSWRSYFKSIFSYFKKRE